MKKVLIIIFSIISFSANYAQTSFCSLKVDIQPTTLQDSSLCKYKLLIEQKIINLEADTFAGALENTGILSLFIKQNFIPSLTVYCRQTDRKAKWQKIDFSFDGKTLNSYLPFKKNDLKIEYTYYSDYFTRVPSKYMYQIVFFNYYNYDWSSWYFTYPGMLLKDVTFQVPDNLYFFINAPNHLSGNKIELKQQDLEDMRSDNLSFYMLEKEYYHKGQFRNKSNLVTLLMTKGAKLSLDSLNLIPDTLSRQDIILRQNETKKIFNGLSSFFKQEEPVDITIADSYLIAGDDDGQQYEWGQSVNIEKNKYIILIDTSAWKNNQNLVHELVHIYNPYHMDKEIFGYYFFSESLVEFLSVYLTYNDTATRDSIFNHKLQSFQKFKNADLSIFQLSENKVSMQDAEDNSANIIYLKVPYFIHQFAKTIGEDKMLALLKDFYRNAPNDGNYLEHLENTAKRNGVNNEEWESFLKSLY